MAKKKKSTSAARTSKPAAAPQAAAAPPQKAAPPEPPRAIPGRPQPPSVPPPPEEEYTPRPSALRQGPPKRVRVAPRGSAENNLSQLEAAERMVAMQGLSREVREKKKDPLSDINYIRTRLANPTKTVSTAELKAEYSYVVNDLRFLALLALGLLVVLVLLGNVIR